MIDEHYRFLDLDNYTRFIFVSEGKQGKVVKGVLFTPNKSNRWNLGFGDLNKGMIDDSVITNNHDVAKVMRTIVKIVYLFFEHYPDRKVIIKPVDEKRKTLYNLIFQRHLSDIQTNFEVIGFIGRKKETYSSNKNYDAFEIKLKSKS